jgi:hypothetical protein
MNMFLVGGGLFWCVSIIGIYVKKKRLRMGGAFRLMICIEEMKARNGEKEEV